MRTRSLRSAVYLAAGIGLVASLFAAAETVSASLRGACTVNGFISCTAVAESGRTTTLGVPDYAWGIAGFVLIFVVAALAEARPADLRRTVGLALLTGAGTALSLYFLYVELGEIHALCLVCASAYLCGWVTWGGALALLARRGRPEPEAAAAPTGEPS